MALKINPHYAYALAFSGTLLAYQLKWSNVYPSLSIALLIFLVASVFLHLLAGRLWNRRIATDNTVITSPRIEAIVTTIFIYVLWGCEFIYEGGVPILKILLKQEYNYRLFGIPSVHVFIVTFSSFYTIFLFHTYLQRRQLLYLVLYGLNMVAPLLIYSRALFAFNLCATVCLYLLLNYRVSLKGLALSGALLVLLSYAFGVMGTLRVSREAHVGYDNSLFLATGQATQKFQNSRIPEEFFWTYIYATSPLANLQQNMNEADPPPFTIHRLLEFLNNEMLFDALSKRINHLFGWERETERTIPGPFNVSTPYSRAFSYLGWIGVLFMFVFVIGLPWVYIISFPEDCQYMLSGLAILCTIFFFLAYDNALRLTGFSFQLIYPLALGWSHKMFAKKRL